MPDRPHRVARLVEVPDSVEVVPVGKLEALAATAAKPEPASQNGNGHGVAPFTNRLDVPRWLADHGVAFRTKERPDSKGRTIYVLDQCPFDSGHGGSGETSIMQGTDGKLAAACMHNSCAGRGWQQFKEAIGAPDPGHYSPPLTKAKDRKRRAKKPITLQSIENASDVPSLCFPEGRTEVANAARLAKMHGDKLRWCHPWNKPLVWDGRRWVIDQQRRCDALAKAVYQSLWQEMASVVGSQDDAPDDDSLIQQMLSFIRQTGTARGIEAMLRLVRSEAGIPITPESLDAHPWLLNCENGTLDLRTGKLLAHRREDCLTKLCQAVYDRDAKCPRWLAFQDRICGGNQSLVDFKQRFYGVCLTGDVSEQILAIYHGTGANGKSTEIETIMGILGADYAIKAASDLLMVKNAETHPTERADLFGKRFVAVVETEHERRLAESLVKELTGGDRIRARRMREDFWEFTPTHKLVIATNHKPVVRGTDHAIWRRLRLVPFSVTIPKPEQDRQLLEKLRTEYPGILAWCVRGCLAWQRDGLGEPAVVTAATSLYRQSQDMLARFIEECCIVASSARVRASDLLAAYRKWSGNDHASQRWLGEALTERSFDTAVIGGYTWRIGIGLKNEDA
jgi:putative DNA primase/helicase